jgi:hypothetical protein
LQLYIDTTDFKMSCLTFQACHHVNGIIETNGLNLYKA